MSRFFQSQATVYKQDVAVVQSFVDSIDYLFKTLTDFLALVRTDGKTVQLPAGYLVQMNQLVIQSLNVFGSTCQHYKGDKKMLSVGTEQYEKNWSEMSAEDKKKAAKYGRYMEMALKGQKLKLYPLLHRTKEQKARDRKPDNVNGAFTHLINARCPINKKAAEVRDNFQTYDQRHEAMHESQKQKGQQRRGMKPKYEQPSPSEMIIVPGQNIRFANDSGDCDMKEERAVQNTFLVKNLELNGNNGQKGPRLSAGSPVKIVKDYGQTKDVVIAVPDPQQNIRAAKVPNQFFYCGDAELIKQTERTFMKKNGALGYDSMLPQKEEKELIAQYAALSQDLFPSYSYQ